MELEAYNVILDTLPETRSRLEVLFRQAGDDILRVLYKVVQDLFLQFSIFRCAFEGVMGVCSPVVHPMIGRPYLNNQRILPFWRQVRKKQRGGIYR